MVGWTLDLDSYSTRFFPERCRESFRRLWEQIRVYAVYCSTKPSKRKSRVTVSPAGRRAKGRGTVVFLFRLLDMCCPYLFNVRAMSCGCLRCHKTLALRSAVDSSTLLAHCLEQHNCNRCSQIQASRPVHWNSDAVIDVGGE